jgi:hypothetical protein
MKALGQDVRLCWSSCRNPALTGRVCSGGPRSTAQVREEAGHHHCEGAIATIAAQLLGFVVPTETLAVGATPSIVELCRMLSSKQHPGAVIDAETVHGSSKPAECRTVLRSTQLPVPNPATLAACQLADTG